jgi:hypothetical protein
MITITGVIGFGQPDVYYPSSWAGKWEVEQTYIAIIEKEPTILYINLLSQAQEQQQQQQTEKSNVDTGGNLLEKQITIKFVNNYVKIGDQVVLDRSFSETNKFQALLNNDKFIYDGNYDKKDDNVIKKALRSALAKWDSSNPNILSLSISDGQVRSIIKEKCFHVKFFLLWNIRDLLL